METELMAAVAVQDSEWMINLSTAVKIVVQHGGFQTSFEVCHLSWMTFIWNAIEMPVEHRHYTRSSLMGGNAFQAEQRSGLWMRFEFCRLSQLSAAVESLNVQAVASLISVKIMDCKNHATNFRESKPGKKKWTHKKYAVWPPCVLLLACVCFLHRRSRRYLASRYWNTI